MTAKEIIRSLMKTRGHTYESLANKMGYARPSGVSERVRDDNGMRISTLVKMLDSMDCELVVRSKLPKDKSEWVVEVK